MGTELGSAYYTVGADVAQGIAGLDEMEARANTATKNIGRSFGVIESDAMVMSRGVSTAAGKIVSSQEEIATSAAVTAGKVEESAVKTESAWGKAAAGIKKKGALGGGMGGLVGLGAAYLVIKGGITWLKDANAATLQVNAAIKATGGIAGVTTQHTRELAKEYEHMTGAETGATMSMESLLLSFKNIRNVGPGVNAIFDRTVQAVENISARTGRSAQTLASQLGKAIQDPTKYLGLLGRAGITFTKVQQDLIKKTAQTKGTLAAQKMVLAQLEARYNGAAKAAGHSFAGQLRIARAEMDQNSATIVQAFIPAFKSFIGILATVSGLMARHKTLLRDLILGYVAYRGVLFAARTAIIAVETAQKIATGIGWLYNKMLVANVAETGTLSDEQLVLAGTTGEATAATEAQTVASRNLALTGLGRAGIYGAALLAGFTIGTFAIKLLHLGPTLNRVGGWFQNLASKIGLSAKAIKNFPSLHGAKEIGRDAALAAEYHTLQRTVMPGDESKLAESLRAKVFAKTALGKEGYNYHDAMILARAKRYTPNPVDRDPSGRQASIEGQKHPPKGAGAKPPPDVLALARKIVKGANLIPIQLQTAMAQAESEAGTKGLADMSNIAKKERTYLIGLLNKVKGKSLVARQARLAIWQEIATVTASITRTDKKLHPKQKIADILTPTSILKRISAASQTKSLADDKAAWMQEKGYLEKLLKNKMIQGDERRAIISKIASVVSKISGISKKMLAINGTPAQRAGYKLEIALAKAELLGGAAGASKVAKVQEQIRKQELKILTTQEDNLKKKLKQKGLSLKTQAGLWKQIASIDKKRVALAKQVNAGENATAKELQEAANLRGTFFGQFASNVFHDTKGGLVTGSEGNQGDKTLNLHQHNHFNEIPKDRFSLARRAERAVSGTFGF